MPKKRTSRGRSKGGKGRSTLIQCTNCSRWVPRDKAKTVTSRLSLVEPQLARELREGGTYIASPTVVKKYCVSCAVHFGRLDLRRTDERVDVYVNFVLYEILKQLSE